MADGPSAVRTWQWSHWRLFDPVWHVLEGHFTLVLANAMHIRNMPERKSDMNDATWIADLLRIG